MKTASHTDSGNKNGKKTTSSDKSKTAGGKDGHNGDAGSKKNKPIQTAGTKSVKDARDKATRHLDPKAQAHINDKIKDNKKLSKNTLKPDADDKNGKHFHKKDAVLPKNAKTFGPTTTNQVKLAEKMAHNPDPKISKIGKDLLAGKPLTSSERKELRQLSEGTHHTPAETAAANQILKQDKQEKVLNHIAAGVGLLGAGIAAGEIFGHHDHFVPGIPQFLGEDCGLPPACDCGPTLFCPCEESCDYYNGGSMPDSCGYCMSTYCEAPVTYEDPGQFMEVPYGDAPVDDGGTLAQNDDNGGLAPPDDSTANGEVAQNDPSGGDPGISVEASAEDLGDDVITVTSVPHHTRYLRVANITGGKLKVYLQYYTEDENGEWDWSPATPESDTDAFAVDLDPTEATDIMDGDWRVNASKVRIWAKSDDGKEWNKFKTVDLDLVPEKDAAGMPTYLADNEETFCFTIK